jgi:hypothetical protein
MFLRHLPFARGLATIAFPRFPLGRRGARRYYAHVAVTQVHVYVQSSPVTEPLAEDDLPLQATFFDRTVLLAWLTEILGPLQLHRLRSRTPWETWQLQQRTVRAMLAGGLIEEEQAADREDALRARLEPAAPRHKRRSAAQSIGEAPWAIHAPSTRWRADPSPIL